jgi:SOS response regulatory protein OraA/RecX
VAPSADRTPVLQRASGSRPGDSLGRMIPAGTYEAALDRAGRLLARRLHSRQELGQRLESAGFAPGVAERALARLGELGLVDDAAFAAAWAEHRLGRGRAANVVVNELAARGVDRSLAERVVADAAGDDLERARGLAAARLGRLGHLAIRQQAVRLGNWLIGRGYEPEVAEAAIRAVLPPEGWD